MDQNLLTKVKDYELRNFIVDFRPYLVSNTVNPHKLATCMGADQYLINLVLEPLDAHSKNDRAYDYISGKNDWARFLMALKESGNSHIENFVVHEINKRQHMSSTHNGIPVNFGGTGLPTNTNTTTSMNMNTMPYQNLHPNTNSVHQHQHSQFPSFGVSPQQQATTTNSAFGWTQNPHGSQTANYCPYPVPTPAYIAVCPPVPAPASVSVPMPNMNTNNIFNPGMSVNMQPNYPPSPNFSTTIPPQPSHLSSHLTSSYQNNNPGYHLPQPSAPSMSSNIGGPPQTNIWSQGPFQPHH